VTQEWISPAVNTVTSKDGTEIGYHQFGQGPGLILIQGAMGTATNFREIAQALSRRFTVYVPDRRGRGMSKRPYSPDHSIQRDVEDVDSLLSRSGARLVFGLSSGAVIALEASRTLPTISKVALYEPPFQPQGMSTTLIARFNREVGEGHLASALVTAMELVRLGPPLLRFVPRCILEFVVTRTLRREHINDAGPYAPLSELLPAMLYDFSIVGGMAKPLDAFRTVNAKVLLLGGSRSPGYLKDALHALERVLPHACRIELKGLDHSAPWNRDRGGDPGRVAEALCEFFAARWNRRE
jgi:pimeloyl-ACP methyl ester carboxylesterase